MLWFSLLIPHFLLILKALLVLAIFCGFLVVYASSAVHAILFLIASFILSSLSFVFLGAEYIGLVFIIVYVGAIAILFLFIIMLLDLRNLILNSMSFAQMSSFFLAILSSVSFLAIYGDIFGFGNVFFFPYLNLFAYTDPLYLSETLDSLTAISQQLYNHFFLYVLLTGYLLLLVMIGVVALLTDTVVFFFQKRNVDNKYLSFYQKVVRLSV